MVPHRLEIRNLFIEPDQFLFQQPLYLTAWRTTFVPHLENACEFRQRKSHGQSTPNQTKAIYSVGRIQPVVSGGSSGHRQHLDTLVMPQRVCADPS